LIVAALFAANALAQEGNIEATTATGEKDYNRGSLGRR
jgi:hypothetical protein